MSSGDIIGSGSNTVILLSSLKFMHSTKQRNGPTDRHNKLCYWRWTSNYTCYVTWHCGHVTWHRGHDTWHRGHVTWHCDVVKSQILTSLLCPVWFKINFYKHGRNFGLKSEVPIQRGALGSRGEENGEEVSPSSSDSGRYPSGVRGGVPAENGFIVI